MSEVASIVGAENAANKVPFCKKEYDVETGAWSFTFGNGTVVDGSLEDFPGTIVRQLSLHGVMQGGGDTYAGAKGDYDVAIAGLQKKLETWKAGSFTTGREGSGEPRVGELAEAVAEYRNLRKEDGSLDVEKAETALKGADEAKLKTIRALLPIKALIARIRARKAEEAVQRALAGGAQESALDLGF